MRCSVLMVLAVFALTMPVSVPVWAQDEGSGLPIPRFVSLRSEKVFVRTGPALRYPIKWVFRKEYLPVEVIQEFDTWRKIRDFEGEEGWIHQSLLSGRRTVLMKADDLVPLYQKPDGQRVMARLEPRVMGHLQECTPDWCELEAGGYTGWVQRNFLWGIYEGDELN